MLKELEQIRKRSAAIMGDTPQKRAEIIKQITEGKAELKAAREAQEAADDMDSYDAAVDTVKRAELKVKFAEKALNKLDGAPRMSEKEYMATLGTCSRIVEKAASDYIKAAEAAMDQLKAAHDAYISTGEDVNQILIELDQAANVLQTKFKNRTVTYIGVGDVEKPDPYEWERHALRFYNADLAGRVTQNKAGDPNKPWDSVLCAAWHAVRKAYPRRTY